MAGPVVDIERTSEDAREDRRAVAGSYAALTVAVLSIGASPLLTRSVDASSLTIASYRSLGAVVVGYASVRLTGGRLDLGTLRASLRGGALFGLASMLGFWALQETSIVNVMVIISMQPLIVVGLAAIAFGDRPTTRQVVLGGVALASVLVLVAGRQAANAGRFGDLLGVVNLVTFSFYLIEMRRARNAGVSANQYMAGVYVVSAVVILPIALVLRADLTGPRGLDWLSLAALGFSSSYAGHGLMATAQRHCSITVSSIASLGSAVVAVTGGWIWFHERLSPVQILSGVTALVALAAVMLDQFKLRMRLLPAPPGP